MTGPARVEVHTRSGCPHCDRALELLRRRGIAFTQISQDGRPGFREDLRELTGRSTVPQIVIDGTPVGGATDLARLDRRGLLVPLAAGAPFPMAVVRRRFNPLGLISGMLGGAAGRGAIGWSSSTGMAPSFGASRRPAPRRRIWPPP